MVQTQWCTEEYNDYLRSEYAAIDYLTSAPEATQAIFTSIKGALADHMGLTGPVTDAAMGRIKREFFDKMEGGVEVTYKLKYKVNGKTFSQKLTRAEKEAGVVLTRHGIRTFDKTKPNPKEVVKVKTNVKRTQLEILVSGDKSFSFYYFNILQTQNDRDKYLAAYMRANDKMIAACVTPNIRTKAGKRGKPIVVSILQLDNRDGLPHIHIHNQVINCILLPDDTTRAVEVPELINDTSWKIKADAVFKSQLVIELRKEFPQLYIEAHDKEGQALNQINRTDGYRIAFSETTQEAIKATNTQAKDTEAEMLRQVSKEEAQYKSEMQKNTTRAATISPELAVQERKLIEERHARTLKYFEDKPKFSKDVHRQIKSAKKTGLTAKAQHETIAATASKVNCTMKQLGSIGALRKKVTVEQIIADIASTKGYVTENELATQLAYQRLDGIAAIDEARAIVCDPKGPLLQDKYNPSRYYSKELLRMAEDNFSMFGRLAEKKVPLVEYDEKRLESLNQDQQLLVRTALGGCKQLTVCQGLPGTGKSFTASVITDAFNKEGYKTIGTAQANKVAKALANDTKVDQSSTIATLLLSIEKEKVTLDDKTVIILDEAGMVGTREYNSLLNRVEKSGARMVMVGDQDQLAPVAAGNCFADAVTNNPSVKKNLVTLKQIIRQKSEVEKDIVNTVTMSKLTSEEKLKAEQTGSHIEEAFSKIAANGNLMLYETESEKVQGLVCEYFKSNYTEDCKIIICGLNKSVDKFNEAVIAAKLKSGSLRGAGVPSGNYVFREGERVTFTKKDPKAKVDNGDSGTIKSIEGTLARIQLDNNCEKVIDLASTKNLRLFYASTVHKAQGITVKAVFGYGEVSKTNCQESGDVMLSRHTENFKFFATKDELPRVVQSFKGRADKVNMRLMYEQHKKEQPELFDAPIMSGPILVDIQIDKVIEKKDITPNTLPAAKVYISRPFKEKLKNLSLDELYDYLDNFNERTKKRFTTDSEDLERREINIQLRVRTSTGGFKPIPPRPPKPISINIGHLNKLFSGEVRSVEAVSNTAPKPPTPAPVPAPALEPQQRPRLKM